MNKTETSAKKSFTVYNMTLIDAEENFSEYSPFDISRFLNTISNEWDWISSSNNGKVFTFKDFNESNARKYEKITSLNIKNKSIAITIKINRIFNQVKGVIYSKSLISLKDEEILESLKPFGVNEVYRFNRNEKATGSFAITFNNKKLPDYVKVAFLNLNVYPLFEKPMQCMHCKLLGHTRKRCFVLNDVFCEGCFHKKITQEVHICTEVCKNCRGNHFTNSKSCPAYTKEKLIIQFKHSKGISYNEAKRRFNLTPINQPASNEKTLENSKERDLLQEANIELEKLIRLAEEQTKTIELSKIANELLIQENAVLNKKYEILSKVLIEAKKSSQQNQDFNKINQEIQLENENLKASNEEYVKKIQSTKYFAMCMKKFIDRDKQVCANFEKFMKTIMQSDSTDEEYEE